MNHQDALRDLSVEQYLLGELSGESRTLFEEHLFECTLCAADLKSGEAFLQAARAELAKPPRVAPVPGRRLLSPAWLVPALAASLLVVAYQSAVLMPALRQQLAQADSPAILSDLVLAGGAMRGDSVARIAAPAHGSFLLSVDVPSQGTYSSYVCSLYSPSGNLVWHGSVTPQQARDTVLIRVPTAVTQAGENTLLVQGVSQDHASGAKLDDLARHKFFLDVQH